MTSAKPNRQRGRAWWAVAVDERRLLFFYEGAVKHSIPIDPWDPGRMVRELWDMPAGRPAAIMAIMLKPDQDEVREVLRRADESAAGTNRAPDS